MTITNAVFNVPSLDDYIRNIRLIAFDFDGVFTDNMVYVAEDGRETVRCYRGDGIGLSKLKQQGIATVVISNEMNPVVSTRSRKLGIRCVQGCDDKRAALETIVQEMGISLSQSAFVGNDVNDLPCLSCVGLPIVVQDAHPDVIPYARYQTKALGGKGAVREVCDLFESVLSRNMMGRDMDHNMDKDIFDVNDKVVIITGGLGQLGRQFSLALVKRGAKVVIWDSQVNQQKTIERFGQYASGKNILFLPVDVTQRRSIESGLQHVNSQWGVPQALINNAALDSPPNAPVEENGPFETYPESSWDKVMQVNVKGVFQCCQVVGGQMAQVGRGSIVNICSIYGIVSPDQRIYVYRRRDENQFFKPVAYAASKSALLNLTRYLSTYWAHKNVRVNTLTFGGVFNNQDQEFLKGYCARVPLGRMAQEDEYNGAIIFLVSDASSYMTGSNVIIDGGWTAW